MTCRFSIHVDQGIACFKFTDRIAIGDARQVFVEYVAHANFDPGFAMLTDARGVTGIDASFVGILTNVQGLSVPLRQFERRAVSVILVAGGTTFGMVRMLEQVLDFASKITVRIARTEASALTAAGRPDADFARLFAF